MTRTTDSSTIFASSRRFEGFTLIESLVVIAIGVILITLIIGAFGRVTSSTHVAKCSKNLQQIGMACSQYAIDHSGNFPKIWKASDPDRLPWNDRLNEYLGLPAYDFMSPPNKRTRYWNASVWWCPEAKIVDNDKNNRHYGLNNQILMPNWNYHRLVIPEPSKIILVGEINKNGEVIRSGSATPEIRGDILTDYRTSHHRGEGANYLFCDGHVEYLHGALTEMNPPNSPWRWW